MKPRSNYFIAKKIAETCIVATPYEKHFSLLQEMFGFDGILNFSQTINELIMMDQMDIFGISKDMQVILKHISQLKALSHISLVRKSFQNIYEKVHSRTVVIVKIGQNNPPTVLPKTQQDAQNHKKSVTKKNERKEERLSRYVYFLDFQQLWSKNSSN